MNLCLQNRRFFYTTVSVSKFPTCTVSKPIAALAQYSCASSKVRHTSDVRPYPHRSTLSFRSHINLKLLGICPFVPPSRQETFDLTYPRGLLPLPPQPHFEHSRCSANSPLCVAPPPPLFFLLNVPLLPLSLVYQCPSTFCRNFSCGSKHTFLVDALPVSLFLLCRS